jgi:hypothetical protein
VTERREAAWQRIAERANADIYREMTRVVCTSPKGPLSDGDVFLAAIVGAQTAALRMLHGCGDAGIIGDGQHRFEVLLREIANIWGQLNNEPSTEGLRQ